MEKTTYEDYLEKNGSLTYTFKGISMMPLLRSDKDLFTVKKNDGTRFKKGDVVLYRRPPEQYVLHRIVEVRPEDYVILGDNCISREPGIRDEDILGVMTAYIRSGKEHSVEELPYRIYSKAIVGLAPLRIAYKRLRRWAARLIKGRK
ncbi:MAG: S24/S26 family peptidase [Ruminococcus sp.]|nr:S24/S26 family peptidase [Ruminococcus sp.]